MKTNLLLLLISVGLYIFATGVVADNIPYGNGTWIYDGTYDQSGAKGPVQAGMFVNDLKNYNTVNAVSSEDQINEVFVYGGDMEGPTDNTPADLDDAYWSCVYYFVSQDAGKKSLDWSDYLNKEESKGDSGFRSSQVYVPKNQFFYGPDNTPLVIDKTGIDGVNYKILVIDGRVDNGGYLTGLNVMSKGQAQGFAKKVARTICSDDSIDGIQFDIEPFSFTGRGGQFAGSGQMYFYQELAKDLAGWYGADYDSVNGINQFGNDYQASLDPIHAADQKHPYGRFFSVFTFSKDVTSNVVDIYKKFKNFYIIDSLYDLTDTAPSTTATGISEFKSLIDTEISSMKTKGIPYQFAIPASASCHEFESCNGISSGVSQLDYVKTAIKAIDPGQLKKIDPNFKGIAIWSWNQAMWFHGNKLTPAKPSDNVLNYLGESLG